MKKKLFVLAIAILITLSTFAILPTISSRHVKTISIGVVLPNQGTFDIFEPVFEEIIEPDINAYVDSLPRLRFVPNVRFEFLLEHGGGNTATHLEKVQYFASIGVDMIIGGFWSSQANASLSYMNENNMLLISPSSTDPGLAIADDVLYRLAIPDDMQAPVMADMILSKGIYNIIVLRNTNPYADWMYPAFEAAYIGKGGWIKGDFRYADENVTTCLGLADTLASTITSDGVLLLGFEGEAANITNEVAASYANINSVPWFGSETTAKSHYILDNSGNNATHLKLYSTLSVPYNSTKYWEMAERFEEETGIWPNLYRTNVIDAAWIIVQSILESRPSYPVSFDATDIMEVLPDVASRYYGYSGWTSLNEAGDRDNPNLEIWGYGPVEGSPDIVQYGFYDYLTGEIHWF